MINKTEQKIFTSEEIDSRVKELGLKLSDQYRGSDLLVIGLLRGSFIFVADLIRAMNIKLEVDFLTTSSYEDQEFSSGEVKIYNDLRAPVEDRDVLVVDDIIDTGHTLKSVMEHINNLNPKSLKSCVLLDKPKRREVSIEADYVGFTIEDIFIVGYGLNYGNYYRNVPYIYTYIDSKNEQNQKS